MSMKVTLNNHDTKSNLYPFFIYIKEMTNNILDKYKNINFLENTSVDIEALAYNIGIKGILPVPPIFIQYDHSHLTEDDIILLNNDDVSEHRFSIAHEIAHLVLGREMDNKVIARSEIPLTENLKENYFSFSEFSETINFFSNIIASLVTEIIDKPVTTKNAHKLLIKTANNFFDEKIKPFYEKIKNMPHTQILTDDILEPVKYEVQKYVFEIIEKVCEEEMADYFAANLLVPIERFILWENETDELIADKFKVSVKCIQKRRGEIERERDFMIPKNQSSNTKIEELKMAPIDELDSILEAYTTHANGGI
jgi:Zn-dependent peptidase ImmA (M78 family)